MAIPRLGAPVYATNDERPGTITDVREEFFTVTWKDDSATEEFHFEELLVGDRYDDFYVEPSDGYSR